jgi:hypothetical protein
MKYNINQIVINMWRYSDKLNRSNCSFIGKLCRDVSKNPRVCRMVWVLEYHGVAMVTNYKLVSMDHDWDEEEPFLVLAVETRSHFITPEQILRKTENTHVYTETFTHLGGNENYINLTILSPTRGFHVYCVTDLTSGPGAIFSRSEFTLETL